MKLTKSQLKQIIKEELQKVLNENRVAKIERTNIEGAESLMNTPPVFTPMSPEERSLHLPKEARIFIVTLNDRTQLIATTNNLGVEFFDLDDNEVRDDALEQEVLTRIRN